MRKDLALPLMTRVVEEVAASRKLDGPDVVRGTRTVHLAARSLAMAVACAAGVPAYLVAKTFKRTWASVDSARQVQVEKCQNNFDAREEFIRVLSRALEPKQQPRKQ